MVGRFFKRYRKLQAYSFNQSGDMIGSFCSEDITETADGQAFITITTCKSADSEPTTAQYIADGGLLTEIERIFKRGRIKFWSRQKMDKVFIADGATAGYSFVFKNGKVEFSSQCFPKKYATTLALIRQAENKALESAVKMSLRK